MRRISLAVALAGALAGCGGNVSPNGGNGKGVGNGTFTVTVQNGQNQVRDPVTLKLPLELLGGKVSSADGAIDCGEGVATQKCSASFPLGSTVTLTATPGGTNVLLTWGGDCKGWDACVLSGNADKYIVAEFGAAGAWTAHPNWAPGSVHGPLYFNATYDCKSCHGGAALGGAGLAPSCGACHENPASFGAVGHFDATKAAWTDHTTGWAQDCQRCHTDEGFRDFIGELAAPGEATPSADYLTLTKGTNTLGSTTAACVAAGTCTTGAYSFGPLKCNTCHNGVSDPANAGLTQVRFPSAVTVTTDKTTALCAQCHQARESSVSIDTVVGVGLPDDQINATTGVSFKNGHYLGAGATLFGSVAKGWAQYANASYTGANEHGGVASCAFCHSPHTGELPSDAGIAAKCGSCHFDELTNLPVRNFAELEESRQFGFEGDIDGDNVSESIKAEIDGLAGQLLAAMQSYASNVAQQGVCFSTTYPYFMKHASATGACDPAEEVSTNAFKQFTPRLMRAAFNYNWYKHEPGAWAHNPRYVIEVIYDSIADLNSGLVAKGFSANVVANGKRAFNGHFGAAEDPSPYAAMIYHGGSNAVTGEVLPTMGFTSDACYQCHGGKGGYATYLTNAPAAMPAGTKDVAANKVTAMQCSTCHVNTGETMKTLRSDVAKVYFPPQKGTAAPAAQKVVSFASTELPKGFALCGTCHSGRENGGSIDIAIGANTDANFVLGFKNPHYLGAAGMMLGAKAGVLYQYTGKAYSETPAFWSLGANGPHGSPHGASCTSCHAPKGSKHTFEIDLATTVPTGTWGGAYTINGMAPGSKNTSACAGCHAGAYDLVPKAVEFEEASAELLTAIQTYAAANSASTGVAGICYNGNANPYFFVFDGTTCTTTSFAKFNPKLLKAAYNYQWTQKEPGAWAHNEYYVLQAIYDSIVDLGGTPTFTVAAVTDPVTYLPVAGDPLNRGY